MKRYSVYYDDLNKHVIDYHGDGEHVSAETAQRLYDALEQAVTSMLDSGYRSDSVVIRACREALALADEE